MLIQTPPLNGHEDVHLWLAYPADYQSAASLENCERLLDEAESSHYRELANPGHRREYLISRAFLRQVLAEYCGHEAADLQFESNESGKPSLSVTMASNISFNFSHGADLMACAVTSADLVGVDVETFFADNRMVDVADHYFSEKELQSLEGLSATDQQQLFFRTWTLKEAYIKARGEGLSLPLDSFSFDCPTEGPISLQEPWGSASGWSFWSLEPVNGQIIALAVKSESTNLRIFSRNPQGIQQELPLTSPGKVAKVA